MTTAIMDVSASFPIAEWAAELTTTARQIFPALTDSARTHANAVPSADEMLTALQSTTENFAPVNTVTLETPLWLVKKFLMAHAEEMKSAGTEKSAHRTGALMAAVTMTTARSTRRVSMGIARTHAALGAFVASTPSAELSTTKLRVNACQVTLGTLRSAAA